MSLINQALRKAQQERSNSKASAPNSTQTETQETPISSTGNPARPHKPQTGLIIGVTALFAILVGLVLSLSILLLRDKPQSTAELPEENLPATKNIETDPGPEPPQAAKIQSPAPTQSISPEPDSTTRPKLDATEEPRPSFPTHTKAAQAPSSSEDTILAELRAARKALEEELAAKENMPDRIIEWLRQAKISAVRISQNGNKVVLNGNTYLAGEYANFDLRLKILVIEKSRVLFVDENGKKYLKRI